MRDFLRLLYWLYSWCGGVINFDEFLGFNAGINGLINGKQNSTFIKKIFNWFFSDKNDAEKAVLEKKISLGLVTI